ncbi:MAG: hypothetical protein KF727_13225 [Microbacteriaceae bacterium]|nr:hypothetical protein [Microbacteriaceae bacterium]
MLTFFAAAVLLSGCTAVPAPGPEPSSPAASPPASAESDCPDITAEDFAIQIESAPADPVELADSVGLADVLEGTCAYGFTSEQIDGVAFFIIGATDSDAGAFFAEALTIAMDAGFRPGDSYNEESLIVIPSQRSDGAAFLVGHNSDVQPNDAEYTPERMAAIGLKPGDSILFGSIQLP